jgi:hypothetical protein
VLQIQNNCVVMTNGNSAGVPCTADQAINYGSSVAGANANHTWNTSGTFHARVTVTDSLGKSSVSTMAVSVADLVPSTLALSPAQPPTNAARNPCIPCDAREVGLGTLTTLTGAITHAGSADTEFVRVDWGDGTTPEEGVAGNGGVSLINIDPTLVHVPVLGTPTATRFSLSANHLYAKPGTYTVTVVTTDQSGAKATALATETIDGGTGAPIAAPTQSAQPVATQSAQPVATQSPPVASGLADMYAIASDGTLNCYQHAGYLNGAKLWQNDLGLAVGSGWNKFQHVFSAAGAIYAIQPDGTMLWYQHNGSATCAAQPWTGPLTIGSGWQNFKQVFPMTTSSGSGAVIYAIQSDGTLQWYQHLGSAVGSTSWSGPNTVGTGWQNFKQVFSTGDGVIYAIQNDGTLQWYKHLGYADGSTSWSGPISVGTGWQNFKQVFSTGNGVIYAIQNDGTLQWYKHLGYADGSTSWSGPLVIGSGWQNFLGAFLGSPALNTAN